MADDNRSRGANADASTTRRESRLFRLLQGASPLLSLMAACIAVATAAWVFLGGRQDVSASAIKSYNFSSPEDALKSVLTMRRNGEFTALRSYDVAFNGAVIGEKLNTLKIHKVREYDGRRILFVSYAERGDVKYDTEAYVRDAESGLWGPSRYPYYEVRDRALSDEMRQWTETHKM